MRGIVKTSAVALSVLALGACSGGGSVLSSGGNTIDRTIVTVQGGSNIARVLPGASIAISAVGVRGSQNGVVSNNRFTWSAAVTTGGQYVANTDGTTKPCGGLTFTPTGGSAVTYLPDFSIYVTIDPSNEANIIFTPPTTVPVTGGTVATSFPTPYCVVVTATPVGGGSGNSGSITVAVVSPAAPLN